MVIRFRTIDAMEVEENQNGKKEFQSEYCSFGECNIFALALKHHLSQSHLKFLMENFP